MTAPLRVGVVGAGSLGFHHVRLLGGLPNARLAGFHEVRPERAAAVSAELGTKAFPDLESLLEAVDAITIAVPTGSHHAVARAALARGKHVLIEKPITTTIDEADDLIAVAEEAGALIQIGHVERFNRAVRAALPHIDGPRFIQSDRLAPFTPRGSDVAVVLDLMIHDLDLVATLVRDRIVKHLSATGVPVLTPFVDIANARLEFASGAVANVTASRVSRERMRKVRIFQQSGYLSLDLATGTGEFYRMRGDLDLATLAKGPLALESFVERVPMDAPDGEPLRLEFDSFVAAVRGETPVAVTGREGRDALETALRIVREIENSPTVRGVAGRSVRDVLIVAGETSGDMHAAAVAREFAPQRPDLSLVGIGGSAMESAGVRLIEHAERLAVMGFAGIIAHIPRHLALLGDLRDRLRAGNVALVILVDYPGLNMKIAAAAAEARVPVLYYITPQVWAWGAGRLARLAETVTRAAVILPFEEPLLRAHGIAATFVGHPLLDRATNLESREAARSRLGIPPDARVLALFPGSRRQEIARHLDDFLAVARETERRLPGLRVVIGVAPHIDLRLGDTPYQLVRDASFTVMRAADAAVCKSGTTTLEAAVTGCPLVVAYRTGQWDYAIARLVVRIPHIGLVNVVAGREVAREFVQDALRPVAVADALEPLLVPGPARDRALRDLGEVRDKLGTAGASSRVAAIASELAP